MFAIRPRRRRASIPKLLFAIEQLELRQYLSTTYYVSNSGSDSNNGTSSSTAFLTIERAAAVLGGLSPSLQPGCNVYVEPGTYAGFSLGLGPNNANGTAGHPITFEPVPGSAAGSVVIDTVWAYPGYTAVDAIRMESDNYITVNGFTITNPNNTITQAGIHQDGCNDIVDTNNNINGMGEWGILTGFTSFSLFQNNICDNSQIQHGMYISNTCNNDSLIGNTCAGNAGCGIHMNGDASEGGLGYTYDNLIEGNFIYDNGNPGGGSGIDCDGIQDSIIENNIIADEMASGISLYIGNASEGSLGDTIVGNTFNMGSTGRYCINIASDNTNGQTVLSTGNVVEDNFLLDTVPGLHGAIEIDSASLTGFVSDHNVVTGEFSDNSAGSNLTLAQWQAATGQDEHSVVSTAAANFVNPTSATPAGYDLLGAAPAIGEGVAVSLPSPYLFNTDYLGNARPTGSQYDSGAFQYVPPVKLAFAQQPGSIVAGIQFSPEISVDVEDANGNIVPSDSSTVTISLTTGPGSAVGTLTARASDGVATFTNLTIDVAATGDVLSVTDSSLTGASSNTYNVTAAAAKKLAFVQQPTNVGAGSAVSPSVTVAVEDQYGNVVTTDSSKVAISLKTGPGTLAGTLMQNASSGVATFGNLSDTTAANGDVLSVTDGSLTGTASSTFNITAAAAKKLAFVQQPTNVQAGAAISPSVTVAVEDQYGNVVTTDSSMLTVALSTGPGTLTGTLMEQASSGVATFSNLSNTTAATGDILSVTDSSLTGTTSNTFNVVPGPAAKLVYLQAPTNVNPGSDISPPVVIAVEDTNGNIVTTDISLITVTLGGGEFADNGTTESTSAAGGEATFGSLVISNSGPYTLTGSDLSLTQTNAAAFNVNFLPATVSGQVFEDDNSDGTFDGTDSGVPFAGQVVYLDVNNTGGFVGSDPTRTTDSNGNYSFTVNSATSGVVRLKTPLANYVLDNAGSNSYSTSSGSSDTVNLGYFPTYYTTNGNYVLSVSGNNINITVGTLTFAAPISLPQSLTFDLSGGSGSLTVDETNGNPIPANGITYLGGSGADSITVNAPTGDNTITVGSTQIQVNGSTITYTGLNSIAITTGSGNDTLTQTAQPGNGATLSFTGGTGTDALNVTGGTYIIPNDPSTNGTASLAVTVGGGLNPASVTFNGSTVPGSGVIPYHLASLTVSANGTATLAAPVSGSVADETLLTTNSLSVTGTLDITSNSIDVHYSGTTPFAGIQSSIVAGNITSSLLASHPNYGVGYADGADGVVSGLGAHDILIRYTLIGDTNLDGSVNFNDLLTLAQHYGQSNSRWDEGDFFRTESVNFNDLLALAQNYGQSVPGAGVQNASVQASTDDTVLKPTHVHAKKRHH